MAFAFLDHARVSLAYRAQLRRVCVPGRERSALALDQPARVDHFERAGIALQRMVATPFSRMGHIDTRADAHVEQAFDFERDQRLAYRGPGNAELPGEIPLRRQARARGVFAVADQHADLVGDLAVQAARLERL